MLGVIDNKFLIGRDEFFPFSAEMHYFRVEKRYWSICFERIKKAGFRILSTYIPWNLHEGRPGEFDFRGYSSPDKDLIVFLELSREFGFKIILKPGPWINAEWSNGGLPKYLFQDESVVARDSTGELVSANNGPGVSKSYQPSYLHPKYLNHMKRYLSGLIDVIQNYIFPKGPVFIVQIDDELSFGGNLDPFSIDYNSFTISDQYYPFLEEKYKTTKNLPSGYGKRVKDFSMLEPPISTEAKKPEELVRFFDWIDFKSHLLGKYVESVRERLEGLGVGCFFSVKVPWADNFGLPADIELLSAEKTLLGMRIPDSEDYCRMGRNIRYMAEKTGFSWTPELYGGIPTADSDSDRGMARPFNPRYHRYLIIGALAAGLKGMNHYMFVGRDHWYGSPLGSDGTVNENYDTVRKVNTALEHVGINSAKPVSRIGIACHNRYLVQHHLGIEDHFPYVSDLVAQSLNPLGLDFMNLKFDYSVEDIDSENSLEDKDLYFIPTAEYMAEEAQANIVKAVKSGKSIVLFGLMPKFNEQFKPSRTLARTLRINTTCDWGPCNITWEKNDMRAIRYGYISGKGSGKIIAKNGARTVGIHKKVGKGSVWFFTFDISPKYDPVRLNLLKSILQAQKITTPVSTSDPKVDLIAHISDKGIILYLINTDTTFTAPDSGFKKKVVASVDLAALGLRQAKIKMYDVLSEDVYSFTSRQLKEGVVFPVGYHEARIFFIRKK
jgi:hypothetical protein